MRVRHDGGELRDALRQVWSYGTLARMQCRMGAKECSQIQWNVGFILLSLTPEGAVAKARSE